jgi:hypothetical protein
MKILFKMLSKFSDEESISIELIVAHETFIA